MTGSACSFAGDAHSAPSNNAGAAVRGRLAPSPTGYMHLGNAYAFLMAWLSARSQGGRVVLRMEDIDPDRSRPEYAQGIMDDLRRLGLDWDEGPDTGGPFAPYTQSERLGTYDTFIRSLQAEELVYPCFCTRKDLRSLASAPHIGDEGVPYPGTCLGLSAAERAERIAAGRQSSLRLNTEKAAAGRSFAFIDQVLGPQDMRLSDCGGDFALRRSDGVTAYQLATALDDAAMGITEVVRGEDLVASTPRQLLLFSLLGAEPPEYAHIPLLLDAAGERLAKRHQSLTLRTLWDRGISSENMVGLIAFLTGSRESSAPLRPAELLPGFSAARLAGRTLILPEEFEESLR